MGMGCLRFDEMVTDTGSCQWGEVMGIKIGDKVGSISG